MAVMEENFYININCSRILGDSDETQYTMFIDSTKISIVYELIEWIRWIFSIEYCVYLSHENSVIHELEDIKLLAKLKNFEIKPCGRSHCVHKTTYRILLSNLNLFVHWNEMKVHKYFVDKISQIDQKLTQENIGANSSMIISSNIKSQESLIDCKNSSIRTVNDNFFFSDSQLSNSSVKDSSPKKKITVIDNLESEPVENGKLKINMKSCFGESTSKSPLKNNLETMQVASCNNTKSKSKKSSSKYFKPFSVGELLSNIRKDFEKQNMEVRVKKNVPEINFSVSEKEDFNDKMTIENSPFVNEDKITEIKKRQRTRKRKKSKRQNFKNITFTTSFLECNDAVSDINDLKSNSAVKPNHIRFDIDDEDNLMENNFVEDNISLQNEKEFEIIHEKTNDLSSVKFFKAETEKSSAVISDNYQDFSNSQQLNSSIINIESKMECSSLIDDLIPMEEKQTDLGNQISNGINQSCSESENFQSVNINPDLNILVSLKENCKNPVVVKRFY